MMRKGAEEARNQLPDLLAAAEDGRPTVITRHGRPIARVTPAAGGHGVLESITSIRANRVGGRRPLKALIRKGRR